MTQTETMIMIGDFGKDLDDENALLYTLGAQKAGEVSLDAVVANLDPPEGRARIAKGMLEYLHAAVPVGVGTTCGIEGDTNDYELNIPYLADVSRLENGHTLLVERLKKANKESVVLVLNSGLTDAAELLEDYGDLCSQKLARVAIMGGVVTEHGVPQLTSRGQLAPDDAANNRFDADAAAYVYERLQSADIPLTITTREAAYACKFDLQFYEQLAATDEVVGAGIMQRQQPAIEHLWRAANATSGSKMRGSLPDRCDRQWFVDTYLQGTDPKGMSNIWATALETGTFQLYDPINVASVARPDLFKPTRVRVGNTTHDIIGLSPTNTGIKHPNKLRVHIKQRILQGVQNNYKPHN